MLAQNAQNSGFHKLHIGSCLNPGGIRSSRSSTKHSKFRPAWPWIIRNPVKPKTKPKPALSVLWRKTVKLVCWHYGGRQISVSFSEDVPIDLKGSSTVENVEAVFNHFTKSRYIFVFELMFVVFSAIHPTPSVLLVSLFLCRADHFQVTDNALRFAVSKDI